MGYSQYSLFCLYKLLIYIIRHDWLLVCYVFYDYVSFILGFSDQVMGGSHLAGAQSHASAKVDIGAVHSIV